MGSGQTALAALKAGRHFVGYELNLEYQSLAAKRIISFRS
jgi:DNA modification methylase